MYGLVVMLTIPRSKVHLTIPIVVQMAQQKAKAVDIFLKKKMDFLDIVTLQGILFEAKNIRIRDFLDIAGKIGAIQFIGQQTFLIQVFFVAPFIYLQGPRLNSLKFRKSDIWFMVDGLLFKTTKLAAAFYLYYLLLLSLEYFLSTKVRSILVSQFIHMRLNIHIS